MTKWHLNTKKPRAMTQGSSGVGMTERLSALPSPHLPERRTHAVAGHAALLLVALACLELAFDLFAVNGVAPLLAAGAAVEHEFWGDLIAVAVLAGGQEGEQITAQASQAQLFVQFLLLIGEELLLLLHLEQAGDAGGDGVSGETRIVCAGTGGEHSSVGQEQQSFRRSGGGFAKGGGVGVGEGCSHTRV